MPVVHGKLVEFRVLQPEIGSMDHVNQVRNSIMLIEHLDTEEAVWAAREALNHLRSLINKSDHTIGYQISPGGILNAYREGGIGFEDAIARLREAFEAE